MFERTNLVIKRLKMKKEDYLRYLNSKIILNIDIYFEYIDRRDLYYFVELKSLINENIDCLLLNNYLASINTTNHLFERFVKLSLISYYTIEVDYSNIELYNQLIETAYNFDSKTLVPVLKQFREIKLIDDDELKYLLILKDKYRNPYAHSDTKKIVGNSESYRGKIFSIEDGLKALFDNNFSQLPFKEIDVRNYSPPLAQLNIEVMAEKNAFKYFKEVFDFILIIDKRLKELNAQRN